jgi:hypothetical protein
MGILKYFLFLLMQVFSFKGLRALNELAALCEKFKRGFM